MVRLARVPSKGHPDDAEPIDAHGKITMLHTPRWCLGKVYYINGEPSDYRALPRRNGGSRGNAADEKRLNKQIYREASRTDAPQSCRVSSLPDKLRGWRSCSNTE